MADDGGSGVVPTVTGQALVNAVPRLQDIAEIDATSFRQIPGPHLSIDDLIPLAAEIQRLFADGVHGFVITQGTDTIEETAFALDLLIDCRCPVVVTGAMRNPTLEGADGPANLLAAVQVVLAGADQNLGVLVVLNDEIHAAQFVHKSHTSSPSTFSSAPLGPIGWVSEGTPRIMMRPPTWPIFSPQDAVTDTPIALITMALGDDGRLIDAAVAAEYQGLVFEAFGGGHCPPSVAEALERATAKIPVVLCSRTGTGEVLQRTYGFVGAEIDLLRRGLIKSGWLDGPKARILLTLLLRSGASLETIKTVFSDAAGGFKTSNSGKN